MKNDQTHKTTSTENESGLTNKNKIASAMNNYFFINITKRFKFKALHNIQ